MNSSNNPVPVVDFSAFNTGDTREQARVAGEIGRACRQVGFFYLSHHGVDRALLTSVFEASAAFFSQPAETKNRVAWRTAEDNLGYVATGRESLDPEQPGDFKEAFNITEDAAMNPVAAGRRPDNYWPDHPDGFRPLMEAFYRACLATSDQVLRAFALDLDLPRDFFVDHHDKHDHGLRLLHYPPVSAGKPESAPRAGGHTDYGSITLLFQDDVGGLEVRDLSGQWRPAPPLPGTILVNTGDLMQRWTNDVFQSTPHRVGASLPEHAHRDRYSIAFFGHPNYESDIQCLPACADENGAGRYPPINSKTYLLERLGVTY